MTDQQRRIAGLKLGLLFGVLFLWQADLRDLILFRLQDVPYRINWLFYFLAIVIPTVIAVTSSWPKNWFVGALFSTLSVGLVGYILGSVKPNIPPPLAIFFLLLVFGSSANAVSQLVTKLFGLARYSEFIGLTLVLLEFEIAIRAVLSIWFSSIKWRNWLRLTIRVGIVAVVLVTSFMAATGYHDSAETQRAVVRFNQMLQATLSNPGAEVPEPLAQIPDFKNRASPYYSLATGPGSIGATVVNIYFDNGFVIGCYVGNGTCQVGEIPYGYNFV